MIYFTGRQISKFIANDDVSTVTIKKFLENNKEEDAYPTFSICLDENEGAELYNGSYLLSLGLPDDLRMYQQMLKGVDVNETVISLINPDKSMKSPEHMVCQFFAKSRNGSIIDNWIRDIHCDRTDWLFNGERQKSFPFYISYRSPDEICITPDSSNENRKRKRDEFKLDLKWMKSAWMSLPKLRIYLHGKGQLIRNFGKEIHKTKLFDLYPYPEDKMIKNTLELSISYVTVIKKRADANIPCYSGSLDDDHYIRQKIIEDIGCVPPYWVDLSSHDTKLRECSSTLQLKKVYELVKDMETTVSMYPASCWEMTVVSSIQFGSRTNPRFFELNINYLTESFQEIANQRDFSGEALWSGVGGLVGIFLGYSMMQIPDSLVTMIHKFAAKKAQL